MNHQIRSKFISSGSAAV